MTYRDEGTIEPTTVLEKHLAAEVAALKEQLAAADVVNGELIHRLENIGIERTARQAAEAAKEKAESAVTVLREVLGPATGNLAEAVANDCDHRGLDHSRWWRAVKKANRVLSDVGLAVYAAEHVARIRREALEEAAEIAENGPVLSMVGGSTGDARGTQKNIVSAIRALASVVVTAPKGNPNEAASGTTDVAKIAPGGEPHGKPQTGSSPGSGGTE